jgi:hypothetical protein
MKKQIAAIVAVWLLSVGWAFEMGYVAGSRFTANDAEMFTLQTNTLIELSRAMDSAKDQLRKDGLLMKAAGLQLERCHAVLADVTGVAIPPQETP